MESTGTRGVREILTFSVPVPIIAPLFVEDDSVLSKRKNYVPTPGTWRISLLVEVVLM